MGCCGKTKRVLQQGGMIAKSYSRHLVGGKKYEFTDDRITACQQCEFNTWMTIAEYAIWLAKNGIKVLTNFDQLEKLPMLPKYELSEKRSNLYCRICKCFIPVKAEEEKTFCPNPKEDKWKSIGKPINKPPGTKITAITMGN